MRSWLVMGWERCSRKATRRCGREGSIAAAFSLALSVALAGCTIDADYEDTSFACEVSGECPAGFECAGGRCVPPGGGDAAGTHADALPAVDSGTADAEAADSCGSPEPIGAIADEFEGSDVEPLWRWIRAEGRSSTRRAAS